MTTNTANTLQSQTP